MKEENIEEVEQLDYNYVKSTQWSKEFEQLMRNRLMMGAYRYGCFNGTKNKTKQYDCITSAIKRLKAYQKTGNMEFLVDVANLMLCEFLKGSHPNKHFESIENHNYHVEVL